MKKQYQRKLNRLRVTRRKAGLGQKSVALLLGHKYTTPLSGLESGNGFPSLPTALALSAIYRIPVNELFAPLYKEIEEKVDKRRAKTPLIINYANRTLPMGTTDAN